MIEFMHNINIMIFPDEIMIIRTNKQTGQIVLLRWNRGLYQTMALQKLLICMKQMTFGCSTGQTRGLILADE